MKVSMKTLARSVAIATLTAASLTLYGTTATADPVAPVASSPQVTATADPVTHTVAATLTDGTFVPVDGAINVLDAAGAFVESIPLTVDGAALPVSATVSNEGNTLFLHQVDTAGTANKLWEQWLWGVNNGGGVGAIIGGIIGCIIIFLIGCAVGAGIGGALTSPNSAEIQATFNDLIAGK